MKDYYSILGLDPDASPDSIKLAYRRLAREAHPDRVSSADVAAHAAASARMAELNEAYATLSDSLKKKDYEEEFRKWQAGIVEPAPAPVYEPEPQPAVSRVRARPATGVMSNVVRQAADQMHAKLLTSKFDWRARRVEGFDWALQSSYLLANYFVLLRGFATLDLAAAQKFINYATLAIEKSRSALKRNHFLLLMPFQQMREPEQVLALARRFAGGELQSLDGARVQIVLIDVAHGRRVPCGPKIDDKRFDQILLQL